MILPRRQFLTGLASTLAAPAIVPVASLMPIRGIVMDARPLHGFTTLPRWDDDLGGYATVQASQWEINTFYSRILRGLSAQIPRPE